MHGHAIAHVIVPAAVRPFDISPGPWLVLFGLLLFSGLLRPLERGFCALRYSLARHMQSGPPPSAGRDHAEPSTLSLNAIELALIAEFSLEQACAHEEVAADGNQRPETRRAASTAAAAWRERARVLQLEASRRGGQPMVPGEQSRRAAGPTYTGPERRRRKRRTRTRRSGRVVLADGADRERRIGGDRRSRDRRRPQLAPR